MSPPILTPARERARRAAAELVRHYQHRAASQQELFERLGRHAQLLELHDPLVAEALREQRWEVEA